jgi:RimJ/RimL family protein N-acetyltransferase
VGFKHADDFYGAAMTGNDDRSIARYTFAADLGALVKHIRQGSALRARGPRTADMALRPVMEADRPKIRRWAQVINSSEFMTRFEPQPDQYLAWDIVLFEGREVGVIWLELTDIQSEASLGVMLAAADLTGRGIGRRAILLMIAKAEQLLSLNAIVLNVREANTRAIACYVQCGFTLETRSLRITPELEYAVWSMRRVLVQGVGKRVIRES